MIPSIIHNIPFHLLHLLPNVIVATELRFIYPKFHYLNSIDSDLSIIFIILFIIIIF